MNVNWLIALCLISDPSLDTNEISPITAAYVKQAAVHLELLDEREIGYWSVGWYAVRTLQERYVLLHNAPPASDADDFQLTTRELNDYRMFNREYASYLDNQLNNCWLYQQDRIRAMLVETKIRYHLYDMIADAKEKHYYIYVRRASLMRLREEIGEANYYRRQLPHHVPIEFFTEK